MSLVILESVQRYPMAEVLGVAGSVVGVVSLGIQVCQGLLK
jgi:hypothetical protein